MIPRYARPEAAAIWSPQSRFKIMFEIEAHAADAMAELGVIPAAAAAACGDGLAPRGEAALARLIVLGGAGGESLTKVPTAGCV